MDTIWEEIVLRDGPYIPENLRIRRSALKMALRFIRGDRNIAPEAVPSDKGGTMIRVWAEIHAAPGYGGLVIEPNVEAFVYRRPRIVLDAEALRKMEIAKVVQDFAVSVLNGQVSQKDAGILVSQETKEYWQWTAAGVVTSHIPGTFYVPGLTWDMVERHTH